MRERLLVTGGAGFIGSHTCVELLNAGADVVVVDNFSNSSPVALERVRTLADRSFAIERIDIRDGIALTEVFSRHAITAVVHFAGLKAVGESVANPVSYYDNNVHGTLELVQAMTKASVRRLVFSSSATVYGGAERPLREDSPLSAASPYGRTKLHIEEMLRDLAAADPTWHIALLRYFNPAGAHPSGNIGENPLGTPQNAVPYMMQVAAGRRPSFQIFGNDYPTPDGTGIRDYIHVVDLARGHLAALRKLDALSGAVPINLGTGRGFSVLELVAAVSRAVGRPLPNVLAPRRPGDVAVSVASPALAESLLGWRAQHGIDDICVDAWRWQTQNPDGYR